MAWVAGRPSSGCGDGMALGSAVTLARGPEESAPQEEYEEHGSISVQDCADGSEDGMEKCGRGPRPEKLIRYS